MKLIYGYIYMFFPLFRYKCQNIWKKVVKDLISGNSMHSTLHILEFVNLYCIIDYKRTLLFLNFSYIL